MIEFKISDKVEPLVEDFKERHKKCTDELPMATDGKYPFTYMFTPGGVGTIVKIKCNGCGKEENITDFDNW